MKKVTLLIIGIALINNLTAQTPLQKADSVFNKNKDYYNSISLYNKALKKATSDETKYIYFQIGECYRNGNQYTQAQTWYQKAINAGCSITVLNLRMGEMLLLSGDYSGAKTYFEKFLAEAPTDIIAKKRLEACNLGLKGQNEKPLFEINVQKDLSSLAGDYGPAYFKNNKIIFSSTRMEGTNKYDPATAQGFSDLYESTYDLQKSQWSKPSKLNGTINTGFNEGTFTFDPTSNYCYYSQCNGASGKLLQCNIMYAHYNETLNTWESSTLFDFNSQTFRIQHAALSADGKSIYFSSDMPGGYGGADIYVIKKVGETWSKPENLGDVINTIGNEGFPFFSGDTLFIFSSDGQTGFGGLDIFMSNYKNGKFSLPLNIMPPINSSSDDFGLVFKNSKNEGLFSSNRPGGIGDDDIYTYNLIPVILVASGNIKDKATLKNLENAVAVFKGSDGSIDSVYTDSKGNYEFDKIKPNVKYIIKAGKKGYFNDSKILTIGDELYSKTFNKSTGYDIDFLLLKMTREEIKIDNIYYDYDKWDLREESKKELDKIIHLLIETPDVNIQISSHTDERGAKNYNIDLSQLRAQSVVNYFISNGISPSRLVAKGYGFSNPVYKNAKTEEQHQMNRRTTFKILNPEESGYSAPTVDKQPLALIDTQPTTAATNTTTTTNNIQKPVSENKYFIIAGSYPSEIKAQQEVEVLKAKGYSNAMVVGKGDIKKTENMWRIAFSSYTTFEEAEKELSTVKKTYPSSWIYVKK